MRDINKIIQDLYTSYVNKDVSMMKLLIDEGNTLEPNNPYIKKYERLYQKLSDSNTTSSSEKLKQDKIIKIGGKTVKCPHCGSNISLSKINQDELGKSSSVATQNFNFECSYCKTNFLWNIKGMTPLYLKISVGNEIVIDGKKYRVSGGVRYVGTWRTINSGRLEYIERILIDTSGDTYYLSESKAWRNEGGESGIEYQTELSRKIVPDFNIGELSEKNIVINDSNYAITEVCMVRVTEVYGENSKSYTIGEEVFTYQLKYSGKDYVFEKEKTNSQKEIGIYHTWEINDENLRNGNIGYNSFSGFNFSLNKLIKKIIFSFLTFLILYLIFVSENTIKITNISEITNMSLQEAKGLYKVKFSEVYKNQIDESITYYDYGGVKHTIKKLEGIKFKIETQKDLDTLKDILNGKLVIKSYQIPRYTFDFSTKTFSQYFTQNTITNYK